VVHRLDAQTQGLVVVAKARGAHAALGAAFEARERCVGDGPWRR
jgi:23S rRNA-/tRNA-specific pseudouridylate synthase